MYFSICNVVMVMAYFKSCNANNPSLGRSMNVPRVNSLHSIAEEILSYYEVKASSVK